MQLTAPYELLIFIYIIQIYNLTVLNYFNWQQCLFSSILIYLAILHDEKPITTRPACSLATTGGWKTLIAGKNSRLRCGAYARPAVASLAEVIGWGSVGLEVITVAPCLFVPTGLLSWSPSGTLYVVLSFFPVTCILKHGTLMCHSVRSPIWSSDSVKEQKRIINMRSNKFKRIMRSDAHLPRCLNLTKS